MKKNKRFLLSIILIIFISGYIASRIQESGGDVNVQSIKIPTQNGQWIVADLFKPETATKKNPAPLVIVIPGFQRSKEALNNIALELARRGIVSISIDPYAQGKSSSSMSKKAATKEGYGMYAIVDYAYNTSNLNYIDKNRIGATGHSAGGNAAIRGASYFGKEAIRTGKPSKLHSVFVSGYVLSLSQKVLKDVRSNVGIAYAFYDEGAYRNELKNADMRNAPEALRLVNSGLIPGQPAIDKVEIGKYYGNEAERNLRIVFNEKIIHPIQPYLTEATANQLEYFDRVFSVKSGLSIWDQTWYWKELMGLIALISAMILLIPMARLLLGLPFFMPLVNPLPEALPRPKGKGKVLFWSLFAFGATVACFSYIPMSELSKTLFVAASTRQQTWFFPQRMNNAVLLWAVFNGLIGFLMFYLSYRFYGKKHGIKKEMWGAQISGLELKRTFLLAIILFLSYFFLLFTLYYFLHVDYRFLFMGVRVFKPAELLLLCMYAPFFFIFFLSNSLRVNAVMRIQGEPEWRSMFKSGIANSLGLIFILIVQYLTFAITGTVYWTNGWLYVNLLFAVVPMMFVLPYFNRFFFRLTGKIYLGPMVTCLIFIMILLTNTVCYLPL